MYKQFAPDMGLPVEMTGKTGWHVRLKLTQHTQVLSQLFANRLLLRLIDRGWAVAQKQ